MTQSPLQITFRDFSPSEFLEARAQQKFEKLQQLNDRISSCHVVFEAPHHHQNKGNLFNVRIELHIPGHSIVVNHQSHEERSHEDAYVALRDAFDKARRQLVEVTEKQQAHHA